MASRRGVLLTGLAFGAAAIFKPAFSAPDGLAALRVGAGRAEVIFPPGLLPLDGFVAEHDPLAVRVLLFDLAGSVANRVAIVLIDLTSISDELITSSKAMLTKIAGISESSTLVCASHTFSAPHIFPAGHQPAGTDLKRNASALQAFAAALHTAAEQAVSSMQAARIGYGTATSRVGVNRDVSTPHGWWLGANDEGFSDPNVPLLRVDDMHGKPLAVLSTVAVQSSITDGSQRTAGGKLISADLAGAAARYIENHYPGAVAFVLPGAAGDQAPYLQADRPVVHADGSAARVDVHEAGFVLLDLLGERLGTDIVQQADRVDTSASSTALGVWRESVTVPSHVFSPRHPPTGPVTQFHYQEGDPLSLPVVIVRIGDCVLVGVQPELAASIGALIRADSPFRQTMVATMVDGAAKYMPDALSYDNFTYEARSSPFARGAAETSAAAITDMLKRLHQVQG